MEFQYIPGILSTMKRVIVLLTLLVTMTLALSAGKAPKPSPPTLVVSCLVCTSSEPMTITGSGFAARQSVAIHVTGPNGLSMTVATDSKGNFTVNYPTGLNFAPGPYTVTASQSGGAWATTGFEIQ
jgi:hypothetical protein